MKRAIIIGCQGQDGRLLYEYLKEKQYQVIGIDVNYIKSSYNYSKQPIDIACRVGNPRKLMSKTGWKPSIDFKTMIKVLLAEEGAFKEK